MNNNRKYWRFLKLIEDELEKIHNFSLSQGEFEDRVKAFKKIKCRTIVQSELFIKYVNDKYGFLPLDV